MFVQIFEISYGKVILMIDFTKCGEVFGVNHVSKDMRFNVPIQEHKIH